MNKSVKNTGMSTIKTILLDAAALIDISPLYGLAQFSVFKYSFDFIYSFYKIVFNYYNILNFNSDF